MRLQVFWRLPVQGGGRRSPALADARRDGTANFDYLAQIGRAAELSHFDGLLIPYSDAGEEPLVIAGALAREIRQLSLVPSFPAQFIAPVYAAKIALSFQRLTRGRLAWNLVIDDSEKPWHGRRRSVAEQVERTGEFLEIVKGIWDGGPFDFKGKYYEVEKGGFAPALTGHKLPAIHLSGDSEAVLELSARHADVHLLALAPVEAVREKIVKLTARAGTYGRTLRFALESGIIARHSDEAAWSEARRRGDQNSNQSPETLGLIGGYAEIAQRLGEYAEAGVSQIVLSANPSLEEAYRIGENLLPLIRNIAPAAQPIAAE